MKTGTILIVAVVVITVLIVGALAVFLLINKREDVNPDEATATTEVAIQDGKFEPETIKVKVGDTVTWTNEDSRSHIVASDPHPIHTDLSALESDNLSPGERYTFTFTEKGEFTYHCHLHPGVKGAVIVE